jgi:hypothetical protein
METSELFQQELEKKFTTPEKFAEEIESIVRSDSEYTYISAIIEYCERNGIEVESVVKLIPKPLKEKLKNDAIRLNFITKSKRGVLPI